MKKANFLRDKVADPLEKSPINPTRHEVLLAKQRELLEELYMVQSELEALGAENTGDNSIRKLLEEGFAQYEKVIPYESVIGKLEGWVPSYQKTKFKKTWERLQMTRLFSGFVVDNSGSVRNGMPKTTLKNPFIKPADIIKWMDNVSNYGFIPPEVEKDINFLELIRFANSLGKEKGLPLLTDEEYARARQGGKNRSGRNFGFKAALKHACSSFGDYEYESICKKLEEEFEGSLNGDTFALQAQRILSTKKYKIVHKTFLARPQKRSSDSEFYKEKIYTEDRIKEYLTEFKKELSEFIRKKNTLIV